MHKRNTNKTTTKNYNLGLNLGTASIGWALTDNHDKVLNHVRGKRAIGTRMFKEGESAADRRYFRSSRRRLARRKWRLRLLKEMFEADINQIDPTFFTRLESSSLSYSDKRHKNLTGQNIVFDDTDIFNLPNRYTDHDYKAEYPTIYHLRSRLIHDDSKADIRLIYLALHHIIKYRGNFLMSGNYKNFAGHELDLFSVFTGLNQIFAKQGRSIRLIENPSQIKLANQILSTNSVSKANRIKALTGKLDEKLAKKLGLPGTVTIFTENSKKQLDLKIVTNILKAVLGQKAQFDLIFGYSDNTKNKDWKQYVSLFTENLNSDCLADMDDAGYEIFNIIQQSYFDYSLTDLFRNPLTNQVAENISDAMVQRYMDHKKQLSAYKLIARHLPSDDRETLFKAYNDYISNVSSATKDVTDTFVAKVLKVWENAKIQNPSVAKEIRTLKKDIALDYFMPKQRTKENAAIPYQAQENELVQIMDNQSRYYKLFANDNSKKSTELSTYAKIMKLIEFRIPYSVGPLVDNTKTGSADKNSFAWMTRKGNEAITPWNFEKQVDIPKSQTDFIKRMTVSDTYLIGESVLPRASLLYQEFVVLNELNKYKVNGYAMNAMEKQAVFTDVFNNPDNKGLIKATTIADYLINNFGYKADVQITGFSSDKMGQATRKSNNSLTTFHDLLDIFGDQTNEVIGKHSDDLEKIIMWGSVFNDKKSFNQKISTINWLSDKQKDQLVRKMINYKGWGRLSKKLLTGIVDQNGENIINALWNSNDNLMQIINKPEFKEAIANYNVDTADQESIDEIIDGLYTSPANKKAIRQTMLVVQDVIKTMHGHQPDKIMLEFARGTLNNSQKGQLSRSRKKQLLETLNNFMQADPDVITELLHVKNNELANDKLYMYFSQNGRDMYTGERLHLEDLSKYRLSHIVPLSYGPFYSLSNLALVTNKVANAKGNHFPRNMYNEKAINNLNYDKSKSRWQALLKAGLITKSTYFNLTTDEKNINSYATEGFVKRQLVETRQIIKNIAQILTIMYPNIPILTINSSLVTDMRNRFDFPKNRLLNDYHNGFDAYLAAFIGNWLSKMHKNLTPLFTYGLIEKVKHFQLGNVLPKSKDQDLFADKYTEMVKIYNYKTNVMSWATFSNNGQLFKQTVFKKSDNPKLIPLKKDKPTNIYGGYSALTTAFSAVIEYQEGKDKGKKAVVPVPLMTYKQALNKLNKGNKDDEKKAIATAVRFYLNRQLKFKKKAPEFKLMFKVLNGQLIRNNNSLFTAFGIYTHNADELVVNPQANSILANLGKATNEELDYVFTELINESVEHLKMYKIQSPDKAIKTFKNKKATKDKKVEQIKRELITDYLITVHANAAYKNLKALNLPGTMGVLTGNVNKGFILSDDAEIIYQSPSGLIENRIKVKNLN